MEPEHLFDLAWVRSAWDGGPVLGKALILCLRKYPGRGNRGDAVVREVEYAVRIAKSLDCAYRIHSDAEEVVCSRCGGSGKTKGNGDINCAQCNGTGKDHVDMT